MLPEVNAHSRQIRVPLIDGSGAEPVSAAVVARRCTRLKRPPSVMLTLTREIVRTQTAQVRGRDAEKCLWLDLLTQRKIPSTPCRDQSSLAPRQP